MKTTKLTLIFTAILTTAMLGAILLQTQGQETLTINVAWDPKFYTWDNPPTDPWNAEIWRQKVQTTADLSTIKLEGLYSPSATPYNAKHGPRVIIPFNGNDVKTVLFNKLPSHMGILIPGTYKLQLVITGNLKPEYGGTPFQGDGPIVVTVLPPPP